MRIPDHLTCLLRYIYASQEAAVRTRHGETHWFNTGKGVWQGSILAPCLFKLYANYIIWNARLEDSQTGIEIVGRNINNFRYVADATLMAESEEELKNLLMRVKEESENAGLKFNIQKTKITGNWCHHFIVNRWGKSGNRFIFLGLQNHCGQWLQSQN